MAITQQLHADHSTYTEFTSGSDYAPYKFQDVSDMSISYCNGQAYAFGFSRTFEYYTDWASHDNVSVAGPDDCPY